MSTIHKYRIWCVTEAAWVTGYGDALPTTCYTDTAHTVGSAQELEEYSSGTNVKIIAADTPPNKPTIAGYKRMIPIEIEDQTASPPTTQLAGNGHQSCMTWVSPPYPINLYGISSNTEADQEGDIVDLKVNKDTVVGVLTAPATASDTTFTVSDTVWQNTYTGFDIALYDSVSQTREDLGECVEVNTANKTITTENACVFAFPAATTTVLITLHPFPSIKLGKPGSLKFGEFDLTASRLEPNTTIDICYTNNSVSAHTYTVYLAVEYGSQNVNV